MKTKAEELLKLVIKAAILIGDPSTMASVHWHKEYEKYISQPPRPTDEEIDKEAEYKFEYYNDNQDVIIGYKIGMKQMRDNYQQTKLPTDEKIEQVACDEMQQDWNDIKYQAVYKEGYIDGAKWVRDDYQPKPPDWNKILKGLQNYCLISGNDKPIIGGKCIDYLKSELT